MAEQAVIPNIEKRPSVLEFEKAQTEIFFLQYNRAYLAPTTAIKQQSRSKKTVAST